MPVILTNDINRGYINFIKSLSSSPGVKEKKSIARVLRSMTAVSIKAALIPALIIYGVLIILLLKVRLLFGRDNRPSELHLNAIGHINKFISQYPMHLYPVVAKSLELSFMKDNIKRIKDKAKGGIIELAVGDGSLSSRIFSDEQKIVCLDINPYSLVHTRAYGHISKRVVADCLCPPVSPRGASLILCNNLLHHVTNKEYTLDNWARIAPYALFNENTNYWASAWYRPFILDMLGLKNSSRKAEDDIRERSLQVLWTKEELASAIRKYYDVIEEKTFLDKKVFFLSSICSLLLFCYGPPTPGLQKRVMNNLLGPITRLVTYHAAKSLIEYDAILPRDKDVFICWLAGSRLRDSKDLAGEVSLVCPDCGGGLQDNLCNICRRTFEEKDGMFFLLPKDLSGEISYFPSKSGVLNRQHL